MIALLRSFALCIGVLPCTAHGTTVEEACNGDGQECGNTRLGAGDADPTTLLQLTAATAAKRKHSQHEDMVDMGGAAAEAGAGDDEASCHTAVRGEACFSNVEWAMKSGIRAHPEWYPGLSASSSFEDFQELLHNSGHGECREPCEVSCRTTVPGETCYDAVQWARSSGIHAHPEWYPGLKPSSSLEAFQEELHAGGHGGCPAPCAVGDGAPEVESLPMDSWGWHGSGQMEGQGWCTAQAPASSFSLKHCPMNTSLSVKVLTYNLFWWNLFGVRGGNWGSAGKLIKDGGAWEPFSVIAFQECDNVGWVLGDAGLGSTYTAVDGGHALAIAYRTADWRELSSGSGYVAEDGHQQWYGKRKAHWVRLQHKESGKTMFIMNHHGPLPIPSGGKCGGKATAYNMLRKIAENADAADFIVLTGDFNAHVHSDTVWSLEAYMHRIFTGSAIGGIDHFFTNCGGDHVADTTNLGSGGSDHDALSAVFKI